MGEVTGRGEQVGEKSSLLPKRPHSNGATSYVSDVSFSGSVNAVPLPSSTLIEPPNQKRSRWRSIRVMYFTMFMSSVTFTMTMSTLWPYLKVVDQSATPSLLGWVVAAYSLGQLVASPCFGFWSARRQAREPLVISLLMQIGANVFYAYVESIHGNGGGYLILARVIMGFASGNAAVVRAYVSGATTLSERTGAMTLVSLWQSVGFILGPVIQTVLVFVGYPGPVEKPGFHFNMYTTPAFLAAVLALLNLVLLVTVFQLHTVHDTGRLTVGLNDDVEEEEDRHEVVHAGSESGSPDYVAVFVTMFLFFIVFFMFTIFETIGTPLTMDMYGWSKTQAALYMGIILATAGVLAIGVFVVVKFLTKQGVDERRLLIAGYIFCVLGFFIYLPWGDKLPVMSYAPMYTPITPSGTTPSPPLINSTVILPWHQDRQPAWNQEKKELTDKQPSFVHTMFQHMAQVSYQTGPRHRRAANEDRFTVHADGRAGNGAVRSQLTRSQSGTNSLPDWKTDSLVTPAPETVSAESMAKSTQPEVVITSESSSIPDSTHSRSSAITPDSSSPSQTTATTTDTETTETGNLTTDSATTPRNNGITTGADTTTAETTVDTIPTTPASSSTSNSTSAPNGCPWNFGWCGNVPQIRLFQFFLGTVFIAIGYPITNVMTYTLYSKILGPQPQGLWMGFITACGSLARTLGPIFVAQIYDAWGPRVTFGSSCVILVLTVAVSCGFYRRLLPFDQTPFRKPAGL